MPMAVAAMLLDDEKALTEEAPCWLASTLFIQAAVGQPDEYEPKVTYSASVKRFGSCSTTTLLVDPLVRALPELNEPAPVPLMTCSLDMPRFATPYPRNAKFSNTVEPV